jgi:hypothetical protein
MDLFLRRTSYTDQGIFGILLDDKGDVVAYTLEHAYERKPKLPPGIYHCVRGTHALGDKKPFVTFEVTGVEGHSGILFHVGNYNKDSSGCVLLGIDIDRNMLLESRKAFERFMDVQKNVDTFTLTVKA